MKALYITDLDGTFLNSDAQISENSKKLISQAINRGALFTVATARTFATVMRMFSDIELKIPLVLMNGVMLYDPESKRILSTKVVDCEALKEVFVAYRKHGIFPLIYRNKDSFLEIEYYNTDNQYQMKYVGKRADADGKRFVYSDKFDCEGKSEVIYIVTLDKYETLFPLYEDIKQITGISAVFYSDNYTDCYFLEIFSAGVSKASAMLQVKKLIGAEKTVAFGDNMNDIEMFKYADESYAVDNACNELKGFATGVIGSNNDDAVAKKIYYDYLESLNG
ncbi:MAG: HAD family hydrolase [Clostridia bacterium]|nr:HAD family hydrolase [Clostridia bacterium]